MVISGLGLVTPLGTEPRQVAENLSESRCVVCPHADLALLPSDLAASVERVNLRPWLLRRKDRKLMSRAARLALPAAGRALGRWAGDREQLGLYVGVGREPPDSGASEPSLVASHREGRLDPDALAGRGRELYPPLLPLLTLPNLVLSHVSINLGVRGPNTTVAGEAAAGLAALVEASHAVLEGRCPAALVGAADSRVDFGTARDLYRLDRAGPQRAPAEGAVFLLIEPEGRATLPALGHVRPGRRRRSHGVAPATHWPLTGDLGAADGLFTLLGALLQGKNGTVSACDDEGASVAVQLEASSFGRT